MDEMMRTGSTLNSRRSQSGLHGRLVASRGYEWKSDDYQRNKQQMFHFSLPFLRGLRLGLKRVMHNRGREINSYD